MKKGTIIAATITAIGGALAFAMHKAKSETPETPATAATPVTITNNTTSFSEELEQQAKDLMEECQEKRRDLLKQIDDIQEKLDVVSAFRYELYREPSLIFASSVEESNNIRKNSEDKLRIAYKSKFDEHGIKDGSKEEFYELNAELDSLKKELHKLPF